MTDDVICHLLNKKNYDLRKSHFGRWIDQKCTPDILWSIADFIIEYIENYGNSFSVRDIWRSDYSKETIAETFSKPGTDQKAAENEYDKVFSQPLNLLYYAGIVNDISSTNRHIYTVVEEDALRYIAKNDNHALRFLCVYIEKVLKDSGLYPKFELFFKYQDNIHLNELKNNFINFYHINTKIKGNYEPKRIFTKVLNPLAYLKKKKGTEKGRLSSTFITKSELMYNQNNFRDICRDKPKDMTRKEWLKINPSLTINEGYLKQQMVHGTKELKKFIELYRENISELTMFDEDFDDQGLPSQVHHIFPKSEFPQIMAYKENLISITPNQHFTFAHPHNNTQQIDREAQKSLLIAKAYSIKQNLEKESEESIFSFSNFLNILSEGFDDESIKEICENNFDEVFCRIDDFYKDL